MMDPGDPRLKFPHPGNRSVLDYLQADAVWTGAPDPGRYDVDDYTVHAHPDLTDALGALGRDRRLRQRAAYGVPVLATSGGVLFALARGTSSFGLRLPDTGWLLAIEMGAVPWPELGPDWMRFDAWDPDVPARQHVGDLRYFVEVAHQHAVRIEQGIVA